MLITLVIIGVVAALTIPNLMQKYQEQTTVKKVQKFYSNLSNAYLLAARENGPASDWGFLTSNYAKNIETMYNYIFKPYFKIAKDCGTANYENCIAYSYTTLNKSSTTHYRGTGFYKLVLDDGSAVIFYTTDSGASVLFIYDINGKKGPNQWGVDTFYFILQYNRIYPLGMPHYLSFNNHCQKSTAGNNQGLSCAAWVVFKGNMDYLHCDGLTWKSRSCKEK